MNDAVQPLFSPVTIVTRLADEGLPICAIARALKMPSDTVRETLHMAMDAGVIFDLPKEDWPPGITRGNRVPAFATELMNDELRLRTICSRFFGTTAQQSSVFCTLLRRSEATKQQLHDVIEDDRPNAKEQTDIKLVDVLICILRRKLEPFALKWYGDLDHEIIRTMWGHGYYIEAKERHQVIAILQDFLRTSSDPGVVEVEKAA